MYDSTLSWFETDWQKQADAISEGNALMESKVKQGDVSSGQYVLYRAAQDRVIGQARVEQGRASQSRAEQRKAEQGRKLVDASSALLCFPQHKYPTQTLFQCMCSSLYQKKKFEFCFVRFVALEGWYKDPRKRFSNLQTHKRYLASRFQFRWGYRWGNVQKSFSGNNF